MYVMDDEAELWQRARQEDGTAFAALFDRHHARVYRRALALLGDVHDADDTAAAAFFELWRKRRSVPLVSGSVLPWLLVTTVNLSRNTRRSSARYRALLRDLPHPAPVAGPDAELSETSRRLAEALLRLAPVDAALIVLTTLEDLPVMAAAESVGLTAPNARVRLHRARARLRVELHDLHPEIRPIVEGSPT
ncbi:RNA polymerase sigma factor [Leifsonia poae]|uniref:RNA polymerase sigma factor n=1 Tax=Leifsonia poae TaxID=110933 RepID=UPI001CBC7FB5|nr:sigma-70 family RNA polymerase sigma factor [Leifsonia poae]